MGGSGVGGWVGGGDVSSGVVVGCVLGGGVDYCLPNG